MCEKFNERDLEIGENEKMSSNDDNRPIYCSP